MKSKHSPEIGIGLPVALQAPENGAPKYQELGLVGCTTESLGQDVDRLVCLLQTVQQTGEMQPGLNVGRLQLEQLAVGPDCVSGQWPCRQVVCLLQPLLGQASVPGRRGASVL